MASAFQATAFQSAAFQIKSGRRARPLLVYYYEEPPPEKPVAKTRRRKVTKRDVEAAVSLPWAGIWGIEDALDAVPAAVPVTFKASGIPEADLTTLAVAIWLRNEEGKRRAAEAAEYEDEQEVELLLLAS